LENGAVFDPLGQMEFDLSTNWLREEVGRQFMYVILGGVYSE
jgi:hypothetical protein